MRRMKKTAQFPRYRIRVRGAASEDLLDAFPELALEPGKGAAVLTGVMPDQAALYGVLAEISLLGLELLEVRCS